MPGFNGTGPRGEGPMTGGGRGFCNPAGVGYGAGYESGFGRGFGRGAGFRRGAARGRGYGRDFGPRAFFPTSRGGFAPQYGYEYPSGQGEGIDMLRAEVNSLKRALDEISQRIEASEKNPSE
ncbi:MAG: DUF5320 domain-containing protein [Desulfobacteraceae bacterium]|nr:DUF5320 domain-containing protein [Desulfobacterales bacterium]MBL6967749.1 DUF5320 domain-containing protein [Desulfobacteraceae bacterium]MBL7173631.1 DUF5320 domain-containing protein [Desulfobacteraceae bacterium]